MREEVRAMRKSVWLGLFLALLFGWAVTASAVQLGIHGQLAHKVQTANTLGITEDRIANNNVVLNQDVSDISDTWASLQYRLWFDIASDDGNVKGVWAFEVGSAKFGADGILDVANAGDTDAYQTRLAYVDVRLPWFASENRVAIGLQEIDISPWLFKEIATGIVNHGSFDAGTAKVEYQLGWVRERQDDVWFDNTDAWFGTVAFDVEPVKVKAFGVYQTNDEPWYIGAEVSATPMPGLDVALTGIYEGGNDAADNDYSAYLVAFNAGYQVTDQFKASFCFWYASGDDQPNTGDHENYQAIKTDTFGSVIFFEDGAFDDGVYASSNPYVLEDNGFYIFRVRGDYQATPRLSVAGAVNYMAFAEDVVSGNQSENSIGWEFDAYANYELYKNVNANLAAGYLVSGDALDLLSGVNDADNLYRVSVGLTYTF